VVLGVTAADVAAQSTIELIPFGGSIVPLLAFGESSQTTPVGSTASTFRQTQGVLAGMRIRYAFTSQSGVEIAARYIATGWREDFEVTSGPGIGVGYSLGGSLVVADVRYTYRPNRSNIYGLIGGGFMRRGGDAWADLLPSVEYETSNPAGLVGFGLRASGSARFQIDVTAELYLYSVDKVTSATLVNGPFVSKAFQSDLMFTVAFPLTFTRG
jgi:hypothetical protein